MFSKHYQEELAFLRASGREFAKANPATAGLLSERGGDPDVERLLEGFAFLTARIRERLDDAVPEDFTMFTMPARFAEIGDLHHDIDDFDALPENAHAEHPLREIVEGVMLAGSKLAGALGTRSGPEDWPPPAFLAGDPLVRLKKARGLLCDALRGLDSADAENLATQEWRDGVRREVDEVLTSVLALIGELRRVLDDPPEDRRG